MTHRAAGMLAGSLVLFAAANVPAATVESFSPQGEVKGVRQVTVRFSTPMVALGDSRLPSPFEIECGEPGSARWADTRTWVYDFDRDLPAGVRCVFSLRSGVNSASGEALGAAGPFVFSTGGPAIMQTLPWEGAEVDEEQMFIVGLDAPARSESVATGAYCDVQGVTERIPVRLADAETRKSVLESRRDFLDRMLRALGKGSRLDRLLSTESGSQIVILQCQRPLPNNAQVRLVWGKGIESQSGVATSQDQAIAFRVRPVFEARFSCERVNKDAHCLPIMPMRLAFSAPMARASAAKIALKAPGGKAIAPDLGDPRKSGDFVSEAVFTGPFAERVQYTLEIPANLVDDAGRRLANQRRFPLQVRTDEYPPLAKFAARFGIVELNGDGMLPVTLRNLEALVESRMLKIGKQEDDSQAELSNRADQAINWLRKQLESVRGEEGGAIPGSYSRIADGDVAAIIRWMRKLSDHESGRTPNASIFTDQDRTRRMHVPKPQGARAFEVIGIPLKKPGFYVVELASPRLGAALLGERNKPYYVQSAALVTNLSVHFKWGRESSLVWVTSLDTGAPVAKARIAVQDCAGKVYYRGETDATGRMRMGAVLPERERVPGCLSSWDRQLVVSARAGDDLGMVFSEWNEGIARWRFNLRSGAWSGPFLATSVLDRSLLRAGETVSMKHYYRQHTINGFSFVPVDALPKSIAIRHVGSEDKYELPLKWDGRNIAESAWSIPPSAKKGTYQVLMTDSLDNRPGRTQSTRVSATFRVEDFRVPLMKAQISGPSTPLIKASALGLDVHLRYLSGGGAGGAAVKVRGVVRPKSVSFPDYDGFSVANGKVVPGIERDAAHAWYSEEYEFAEGDSDEPAPVSASAIRPIRTQTLELDASGSARVAVTGLPVSETPQELAAEMEYMDPNGETLTTATGVALWPSKLLLGVKPDSWASSPEQLKFQVQVLNISGKPVKGQRVKAELLLRQPFAHRKRLVGGFYGYESGAEVKKLPAACNGVSDERGRVFCNVKPGASGNILIVAQAKDTDGNPAYANASAWIAGGDDWWFDATNDDRMDVVPERKRYEPGQTAQIQVRMPFRNATALITVEREGVIDSFVQTLTGTNPVIRLPVKNAYAPNVFVSVLAVRGRSDDVKPTALVDLGKPAFKLGVSELNVGWRAHELAVKVIPERETFKVRQKARVTLQVTERQGGKPARGAEIAIAAVDEGLLELLPNDSWQLLKTMMSPRGIEVDTSTASMQVVGKRHYGRKALPQGGGGGRESARELFETLLYWNARVPVDDKGMATVEIPLNDSLSAFRIVAVADVGAGLFGSGEATIRTTQDVQLISGLPQTVRTGDLFEARFTVRNAAQRSMNIEIGGTLGSQAIPARALALAAGEAREVAWKVNAVAQSKSIEWDVIATERTDQGPAPGDRVRVSQRVVPAVPVQTLQATLLQLDGEIRLPVARPSDALEGRGGIRIVAKPKLGDELAGVRDYMQGYAYTCLEQKVSRAIALADDTLWARAMDGLPAYLDGDGLAKYFSGDRRGSDTLTAYILAIADEAGRILPKAAKQRMLGGLQGFVEGRVVRDSALQTADLAIRKVAALEALSRAQPIDPKLLSSFSIEPNLWPTSAVIDWHNILKRGTLPDRDNLLSAAEQILRSRLNFQGTTMGFSTERTDYLWWLMISGDVNANRVLLAFLDSDRWREDVPRLVRGALGRQSHGRWNTTVANAWGVIAMQKFSQKFENVPVSGMTSAAFNGERGAVDWAKSAEGATLDLGWPATQADLGLAHAGGGRPWVTVQSRAAVPLLAPLSSGYRITKSVTPVETKAQGRISRGDTMRVRLELEAQSDMTWVVVDDPVPSGATILGRGLGGESQILESGEQKRGFVWPAFEERTFEAFRAYYRFVPKGTWVVEYTVRLNNAGRFELPPTRAEAMYAPEMFGSIPNAAVTVEP